MADESTRTLHAGALLRLPAGDPEPGLPLVVALHGAGSTAAAALGMLAAPAHELGLALLAPQSRGRTWDLLELGSSGPDAVALDVALDEAAAVLGDAPGALALAGFSDGASYALSLGLAEGDRFGDLLAFSPGFAAPPLRRGRPRIFVCHGTADRVLPIDRCSRRLVPALRADGYDVRYEEFDGGHVVVPGLVRSALARLAGGT